PVWSCGSCPSGPQRLDPREEDARSSAAFGEFVAGKNDIVFADDDGCAFIDARSARQILETARRIWQRERAQADAIRSGTTLRSQLRFADYLAKRAADPNYTFRKHLRILGGAIEE